MKSVGIMTFEQHEHRQKNSVGSSRIRGTWLLNYWPEAELYHIGRKYAAIIFQKAYFIEYAKVYPGVKILDLCDPDWLEHKPVKQMIDLCDAVTTSSEALAEFVRQLTDKPVVCIPDRMDLAQHKERKTLDGKAKKVVWFGYHTNHSVLDSALPSLAKRGLGLTVISDLPYYPGAAITGLPDGWFEESVTNIKYDHETINEELIAGGDIVLNPQPTHGRFKFKSENKTFLAWALGLPVAKNGEELDALLDPVAWQKESDARRKEVEEKWATPLSVEQYKNLIHDLLGKKGE